MKENKSNEKPRPNGRSLGGNAQRRCLRRASSIPHDRSNVDTSQNAIERRIAESDWEGSFVINSKCLDHMTSPSAPLSNAAVSRSIALHGASASACARVGGGRE